MKRHRKMPIPQKEFGFTMDTFNLIQDWTMDGELISRERERAARERERTEAAQPPMLPCSE